MDYYATGRTNYFKVKDVDKFNNWVTSFGGEVISKDGQTELVGIIVNGIPDMKRSEDSELVEFDFYEELKGHLKKGQVAVYTESGSEGHRYVVGCAVAVCPGKEDVAVNIDSIYDLAAKSFHVRKGRITEAAY